MRGDDVKVVQNLLAKDGFLRGQKVVDGVFGAATGTACKNAKWSYGYPDKYCIPTAGPTLVNYMRGTTPLPLAYRIRRQARRMSPYEKKVAAWRASIAANARWGAANQASIHYAEIRPIPLWLQLRALPFTTDCSGWATLLYKWAGAPDPNGLGFIGEGFTGTLLAHGKPITQSEARPGDLVIWGVYPGHHVAVCVEAGPDPLICSHGSESNPVLERTSTETAAQGYRSYQWRTYF